LSAICVYFTAIAVFGILVVGMREQPANRDGKSLSMLLMTTEQDWLLL
jgi:hypothetical protein